MKHQVDHCNQYHALTALFQCFVVLRQSTILAQPRERSLHDPALGQHDEAVRRWPLDDLDEATEPAAGPIDELARVAAVREDQLQSSPPRSQLSDEEPCAVSVLNVGGGDHQGHDQAERVDDQMTLAAEYFLARIVP